MPVCSGLSASVQPSDEDKQHLTPVVKDYLTKQLGQEPSVVKITEVSRQIVNGTNHFLKTMIIFGMFEFMWLYLAMESIATGPTIGSVDQLGHFHSTRTVRRSRVMQSIPGHGTTSNCFTVDPLRDSGGQTTAQAQTTPTPNAGLRVLCILMQLPLSRAVGQADIRAYVRLHVNPALVRHLRGANLSRVKSDIAGDSHGGTCILGPLVNSRVMYLLHPSPTPPTEEEKKRLLPPVEEYMQSVLGQVPGDIELLELVSEMDRGCFYGVKVKFGEQLWHMQLYHSPIIYGIDIIALKHHAAQEDERLHPY
ncbi:hypothetical protein EGR_05146 [Echinococcus granulosus]|uniref:Uncharacterized protein n=1 Tax=Echinococcus granulosus TaxID=6210 RepID=W6UF12_ECHGR|nr:hypothetical protein EGR_05146 [Echinococcus granulosus]EUB59985.1 hypothetical protein EGR_05146 [Echinococcus granulosus]